MATEPQRVCIILTVEELARCREYPCTEPEFVWAELRDGRCLVWNDHYEQSSFSLRKTFPLERRGTPVTPADLPD